MKIVPYSAVAAAAVLACSIILSTGCIVMVLTRRGPLTTCESHLMGVSLACLIILSAVGSDKILGYLCESKPRGPFWFKGWRKS